MTPRERFKGYPIFGIVLLIALLQLGNIYLIYENSLRIEHNKNLHEEAEKIKVNTIEIIRNLHLLDMSLRSYALVNQQHYLETAATCIQNRDIIFNNIEGALQRQDYPMRNFYLMKDSVNLYYRVVDQMTEDLLEGRTDQFIRLLTPDPGFSAWEAFQPFSVQVNAFEDRISMKAQLEYQRALKNSYWLQVVLFLVTIPTLAYTAYYTVRSLNLSDQLTRSIKDNFRMVSEQNAVLEQRVSERTREIAAHNDRLLRQQREIQLQGNELREQNEELQNAKRIIEIQNQEIKLRHDQLELEVNRQTQNLKNANLELIEHNDRLEQFAYIISHNLRAPMARINGLAAILEHPKSDEDANRIIQMMVKSTGELDQVIKDLGTIIGIQKPGSLLIEEVDLKTTLEKVSSMLELEMADSRAQLIKNLEVERLYSLPPYIDSIFYNLISNALKYRHPDRDPVVTVNAKMEDDLVRIDIADNGLGIDLESNGNSLFNLYKRFHFHVEGKGLGLYLVKNQIVALGGRIKVQSKVFEGTTFTLFFSQPIDRMLDDQLNTDN